jgi:hypothetical protein
MASLLSRAFCVDTALDGLDNFSMRCFDDRAAREDEVAARRFHKSGRAAWNDYRSKRPTVDPDGALSALSRLA